MLDDQHRTGFKNNVPCGNSAALNIWMNISHNAPTIVNLQIHSIVSNTFGSACNPFYFLVMSSSFKIFQTPNCLFQRDVRRIKDIECVFGVESNFKRHIKIHNCHLLFTTKLYNVQYSYIDGVFSNEKIISMISCMTHMWALCGRKTMRRISV